MLSQTAEHAIRALLYLAGESLDRAASTDEVAAAIDAPRNYLAKTLNALARAGILSATKGPGGGYQLQIAPEDLAVSRVIEEFDPPAQRHMCLLGGRPCDAEHPCEAHDRWVDMWRRSGEPLRDTMLADLIGERLPAVACGDSQPLLQLTR